MAEARASRPPRRQHARAQPRRGERGGAPGRACVLAPTLALTLALALTLVLFAGTLAPRGALAGTGPDAAPRLALVVGNAAYQGVAGLDNPGRDAALIARTLEARGFAVTLVLDAGQAGMTRAIAGFGGGLRAAGPEATGLFYYAGHGVQSFGTNYLVPVDARLTDAADLGLVAVPAEAVLRQMASARNRTNIVILDACRDNPFVTVPDMNDRGLAEMNAPTGTFLAYATAPGAVALDGQDGNSPFTRALVTEMAVVGLPLEQLFRQVRVRVLAETRGRQTPWDASSLTAPFHFLPPETLSAEELAARQLWQSVKETRDPVQIMLFLRAYPDSRHADEARAALAEAMAEVLAPAPAVPAEPAAAAAPATAPSVPDLPSSASPAADPSGAEAAMIEAARRDGGAEGYRAYLAAFPEGTFAELARFEIALLAAPPPGGQVTPAPSAPAAPPGPAEAEAEAPPRFDSPLATGGPGIEGLSIAELVQGTPRFAPLEGLPAGMWQGQTCASCHVWTREALCDQGRAYLGTEGARALGKPHPYGGPFKRALRLWAAGGCE